MASTTNNGRSLPAIAQTVAGGGRKFADRMALPVVGTEGHDLKCGCEFCGSSDAGRVHQDTGFFHCYACKKNLLAWDYCKLKYGHDEAKRVMVELGMFEDWTGGNGNGHSPSPAVNGNGKAAMTDEQAFLEICRTKRMPPDAVRTYGGKPWKGGVRIPMFGPVPGPDGLTECSSIHITPENGKGKYEFGKPTGIFLPGEFPNPGQSCIIVEGPKDAAALHALGHLAIGLPSNQLKKDFAPLFRGVHVIILTDGDKAGRQGGAATATLLRKAGAASVKIASFPDGKDARDVLAEEGPEGIGRILLDATEEGGEEEAKFDFGWISGAELLRKDCAVEFFIPEVFAKDQHLILGGPLKCCKTLIGTDLAVSLATGGMGAGFLNHFPVTRPVRTMLACGESGWPVFKNNLHRIGLSRGLVEDDLANLQVSVKLPKFGNSLHQTTLANDIIRFGAEVVILDCAYRCISGESVSNQFSMGEVLDSIGVALETVGATLVLLCHTPKHVAAGEPLELDNLAFAGFSEFAAQWLIVNRQRRYVPGSGRHDLWVGIGGRAGHSGTYAIGIDEGEFHQGVNREWRVEVSKADEARKQQQGQREKEREEKQAEKLESNRKRICNTAAKFPAGESKTIIRDRTGLRSDTFNPAWASLLDDGILVEVEIFKSNHKKPSTGYRLRDTETP